MEIRRELADRRVANAGRDCEEPRTPGEIADRDPRDRGCEESRTPREMAKWSRRFVRVSAKDREDHQEDVKMRRSVKIHDRKGSDREGL